MERVLISVLNQEQIRSLLPRHSSPLRVQYNPISTHKGITSSRKHSSLWTCFLCCGSFALAYLSRETWANVLEQCQYWRMVRNQLFNTGSTCRASVENGSLETSCILKKKKKNQKVNYRMNHVVYIIQDSGLNLILPGGWQFRILWHPESQTGLHTSWCLCLPVETLQTVKYFETA